MRVDGDEPAVGSSVAGNVDDAIVAVVAVPRLGGQGVLGTAFVDRRDQHFSFTARHVIDGLPDGCEAYLMFAPGGGAWLPVRVADWEGHPSEDIAVLRLERPSPHSGCGVAPCAERPLIGQGYHMFGYPEDDYFQENDPRVLLQAAYIQGYLRRRLGPVELPGVRGTHFLELSTVAGGGCSGAPIFTERGAVGIYVGERRPERDGTSVGYAAPFAAVADWKPALFGAPVVDQPGR